MTRVSLSIALLVLLSLAGCAGEGVEDPSSDVAAGWSRVRLVEPLPIDRPLTAGFLVVDGVYNSELMAPYDIFQHTIFHTDPAVEVFTVSPDGKPVTTFEGLTLVPHHSFADAPEIDVLVVPQDGDGP